LTPATSRTAEILAATFSPNQAELERGSTSNVKAFAHEDLARMIRKHPRGKFYDLDADPGSGNVSSSEEAIYDIPRSRATPSKSEAELLAKHFPSARQVIFLPMWDATASRFSTLFAYTSSDFRAFASNPDFLYCIAFSNCVMTEITRIATMAADQQKSDFIGSVSHELRSPLHGILASCEFLTDTETSTFQQSLIDTADSCARTLLDTINMVLDYSKINAFERNARKVRKKSGDMDATMSAATGQPQLNIFGNVDLASITEEVVEGVATGQVFKDSLTGFDAVDLADSSKQTTSARKEVEIILDISPRANPRDWIFVTQPGAFRRIIMNIFGNALKYTRSGYIRVRLEAHTSKRSSTAPGNDEAVATSVKLTITDTGQGMSPQFMRTKLYTPFAQENSIAPGTGLGLSLVKSMVTMLNGEINIQSALGSGTEVTVTFPMTSVTPSSSSDPNSASTSTPTSAGSIERIKDQSLGVVQKKAVGRRAMLFPDSPSSKITKAAEMVRSAMYRYLSGWYNFDVVAPFSIDSLPDIIVTDEADLQDLLLLLPGGIEDTNGPMIIVLCSPASRRSDKAMLANTARIEAVSYPFGPFKLARSVRLCLEKLERTSVTESEKETQATASADKCKEPVIDATIVGIDHLTLQSTDPTRPTVNIIRAGSMAANEDSVHAQLVVESSTDSSSSGAHILDRTEYPFPGQGNDGTISPSNLEAAEKDRPPLSSRKTVAPTLIEIISQHAVAATPMSSKGTIVATETFPRPPSGRAPRLLLVDDNKVNLRLLQTFMKKRKYADVFSAEDGSQAVSIYRDLITQQPPHPPDVIFMDISMPIMNGFQATREIREIEQVFREQFPSPMQTPASSLIIALTGLASGRDQSEAFTSGYVALLTHIV
jgi:signal transduction histidine kinase/CheY-like chemotaxis protein